MFLDLEYGLNKLLYSSNFLHMKQDEIHFWTLITCVIMDTFLNTDNLCDYGYSWNLNTSLLPAYS